MARKPEGRLTKAEAVVVKALLAKGWRNQDIQALVNVGRAATINSARVTEVKQNARIAAASDEAVAFYIAKKKAFDPRTGLNLFDDERLIRSREAMAVAVQIFNSPTLSFKTEIFAILVNVAWTYLLHEHYIRKKVKIVGDDGRTLLLSQMLRRQDCPLSAGMKRNLDAIKLIRDDAANRVAALERALRPAIDLDLLRVPQTAVEIDGLVECQRAAVDEKIDARPGAAEEGVAPDRGTTAVDAADRGRIVSLPRCDETGNALDQIIGGISSSEVVDVLAGLHGHARCGIAERAVGPLGGDNDLVNRA